MDTATMNPLWLRIVKSTRFSVGPTIPFILGALKGDSGTDQQPGKTELHDLLLAMRDDVAPEYVSIQSCPDIGAHVVVANSPPPPKDRPRIASTEHPGRALYYRDLDKYQVNDLEALVEALWEIHKDAISSGRFSRRNLEWQEFNDEDRKIIAAAKLGGPPRPDPF
jgi:hypothetical protein